MLRCVWRGAAQAILRSAQDVKLREALGVKISPRLQPNRKSSNEKRHRAGKYCSCRNNPDLVDAGRRFEREEGQADQVVYHNHHTEEGGDGRHFLLIAQLALFLL